MILVTVGTNEARFDRLLAALEPLSGEELLVQHGPSPVRPPAAECFDYLPFEELAAAIRRARVVVTHAGVGSVMTSLANGKRPIVVPRLARFAEAVDDHQVAFGRRLAALGLVALVEDPAGLPAAIVREAGTPALAIEPDRRLVGELRAYLASAVGDRS